MSKRLNGGIDEARKIFAKVGYNQFRPTNAPSPCRFDRILKYEDMLDPNKGGIYAVTFEPKDDWEMYEFLAKEAADAEPGTFAKTMTPQLVYGYPAICKVSTQEVGYIILHELTHAALLREKKPAGHDSGHFPGVNPYGYPDICRPK